MANLLLATFMLLVVWRGFLILVGVSLRWMGSREYPKDFTTSDVPVYSLLVPLFHEAEVVPQIAEALSQLKWQQDKLDIQILLEAEDTETIQAARKARFPYGTRLTIVPVGTPRTKPRALNHGLQLCRGTYVTVYDAEDIPDPDQLLVAFATFKRASKTVACLQAPLVGENANRSWLAAHWSLEYAVQFGLLMPALALYRAPILIGGTSNHFRVEALHAVGGWDAWNVTEDADLGMRLSRAGLVTATINSSTREDAPTRLSHWLAQRSRWIKGFMQTWLVLMRHPMTTVRQMGFVSFCVMQFSLGGAIIAPVFYAPCLFLAALVSLSGHMDLGFFGAWLLVSAAVVGVMGDLLAPGRLSLSRVIAAITRPIYWLLLSVAAYRAIWELANKPFFWAKTPHTPRSKERMQT